MTDVFLEQIVKKKPTMKDLGIKILICVCAAIIAAASSLLLFNQYVGAIAMLLVVGAFYYAWYIISGLNLEFEYIYTNGEIDFDKVSAKRKRKRVISIRVSSFKDFGKFDFASFDKTKYDKVINMASRIDDEGVYYATFTDLDKKNAIILFSPNEKLLKEINTVYERAKKFGIQENFE